MNSLTDRIKRYGRNIYLVVFLTAAGFILLYDIITGIYPFGEYSFLRKDLYHQYFPFLMELRRRLLTGEGLNYSFNLGIGDSFYAMYVYYLSDPLNYLSVFIPEKTVLEYLTLITELKMVLASVFMCRYLRFKNDRTDPLYTILLSLCYGFSGFVAAYGWNVMWMWGVALAPLVLMGFEKIIKGESSMQYILCLAFATFTNYYMAMVISIFLVIWFIPCIIEYFRGLKETFVSLAKIFFSSVIAIGMSGVLLVPEYMALTETSFIRNDFPEKIKFYMSLPTLFLRSLLLVEAEDGLAHDPNIYMSLIVLMILPLFFMNPAVKLRDKLTKGALILLFYLSFNTNVLEYIWHGLNYPDSIPAREGFLFIILILGMVNEGLSEAKDIKRIFLFITPLPLLLLFITAFLFAGEDSHLMEYTWVINIIFISLYLINYIVWVNFEGIYMKWGRISLTAFLIAELLINFCVISDRNVERGEYFSNYESYKTLVASARKKNQLNQGQFTRFASLDESVRNEGALIGYANDSYFSSTISSDKEDFFEKFGMKSSRVHYMASGHTPFTMAILGVDYILADEFRNNQTDYDIAYYQEEKDGYYLYRNLFPLPFGYTVPSGEYSLQSELYEISDPIDRQNQAAVTLGGEDVFVKMDISEINEEAGEAGFTVPEEGHYYAYAAGDIETIYEYKGEGEDELYGVFRDMDYRSVMDLGRLEKGEEIRLVSDEDHEDEYFVLSVYRFDPVNMQYLEDLLSNESLTITDFADDHIEGIINISKGRDLVLAMPDDMGWSLKVDGYSVDDTRDFYGMLMQIPLSEGYHHIDLSYHIPGMFNGILISVLSVLAFSVYCCLLNMGKGKKQDTGDVDSFDA